MKRGGGLKSLGRSPSDTCAPRSSRIHSWKDDPRPGQKMANPRTPAAKAAVSGAAAKNPKRHKDRKTPKKAKAIGPPYKGMTKPQIAVWREQVENMPWLHAGHRLLLRQVCILAARMETDPDMGVSALQALGSLLSKLGATPVDETKVNHGGEEDEDPDDKLF